MVLFVWLSVRLVLLLVVNFLIWLLTVWIAISPCGIWIGTHCQACNLLCVIIRTACPVVHGKLSHLVVNYLYCSFTLRCLDWCTLSALWFLFSALWFCGLFHSILCFAPFCEPCVWSWIVSVVRLLDCSCCSGLLYISSKSLNSCLKLLLPSDSDNTFKLYVPNHYHYITVITIVTVIG